MDQLHLSIISEYAISDGIFKIPAVEVNLLNDVCKDYSHLQKIKFPHLASNQVGILIGADAILQKVHRNFTTGPENTHYGVSTLLRWTVTGPILPNY